MMTYLDCWIGAATALLSQALAGEPELVESLPKPLESGAFGFAATVAGDLEGRLAMAEAVAKNPGLLHELPAAAQTPQIGRASCRERV